MPVIARRVGAALADDAGPARLRKGHENRPGQPAAVRRRRLPDSDGRYRRTLHAVTVSRVTARPDAPELGFQGNVSPGLSSFPL